MWRVDQEVELSFAFFDSQGVATDKDLDTRWRQSPMLR